MLIHDKWLILLLVAASIIERAHGSAPLEPTFVQQKDAKVVHNKDRSGGYGSSTFTSTTDYTLRSPNTNFTPYEIRGAAVDIAVDDRKERKPYEGILMGIRLTQEQSNIYQRALFHYSIRSGFIGLISSTVTSALTLILSSSSSEKKLSIYLVSNHLKSINKKILHLSLLLTVSVIETVWLYIHTLRTVRRVKFNILKGDGGFSSAASRAFIIEQLKHTLLNLPRPLRPALGAIPSRRKTYLTTTIVWMLLTPIWAVKNVYTFLNRFNNGLGNLLTIVASKSLPTIVARSYLPFVAVPGWALWNYFKAKKVMTEMMCFSLGGQIGVDIIRDCLFELERRVNDSGSSGRWRFREKQENFQSLSQNVKVAIVRACCISILTYSCVTPIPVITGDNNRPTHLRRHAALEAMLEGANQMTGYVCDGLDDLDSVDVFVKDVLPSLTRVEQVAVIKVLALGLVINGSVSIKDKIIFARALRACGETELNSIDLDRIEKEFRRGNLTAEVFRFTFKDEEEQAYVSDNFEKLKERGRGGRRQLIGKRAGFKLKRIGQRAEANAIRGREYVRMFLLRR
ncbi:hypothetical protein TrVE_jg2167 [Triparma verrucosa]|uniref:Uncharacterized protein n=1 Tax=Triparma verrucosa TaxID=1606542 RepID=A0A9W7FLQ5_9STRA|nr:hypothetical protein TrVE_jg2167 [Triparma verrucosa]